jgi:hypothetical protein
MDLSSQLVLKSHRQKALTHSRSSLEARAPVNCLTVTGLAADVVSALRGGLKP